MSHKIKKFLAGLAIISSIEIGGCAHNEKRMLASAAPADDLVIEPFAAGDTENNDVTHRVINAGESVFLADPCAGRVALRRESRGLVLSISESKCAKVRTYTGLHSLNGTGNSGRFIELIVNEDLPGWHKVEIGSNNYFRPGGSTGNANVFYFYVPARVLTLDTRVTNWVPLRLPRCGGTVRTNINQGVVNVVIAGTSCTTFDILSDNGGSLNYSSKPIPRSGGTYSASFTLPQRFYEYGNNGIMIRIYTPFGNEDRALVKFPAQRIL